VNRLAGKIAFITGTGGGQGRAAALLFAAEGAHVIACDVNADGASQTVSLVRDVGGRIDSFSPVNLVDHLQAKRWVSDGIGKAGGIDILYNNAAAARFGSIMETSVEDWDFTLRHEIDLIFHVTQAAWPHLIARAGGTIINTASSVAYLGSARVGAGAHVAAKGAVMSYTRQLAAEGASLGIRVNSISPGAIETAALAVLSKEQRAEVEKMFPLGRIGVPEDVAYCALYLASDEAGWVTGADFVIDGGLTAILK
jgi:NAD(P)-dependent dehydrogenase (short-subunit alcohol dehydrogenase family)